MESVHVPKYHESENTTTSASTAHPDVVAVQAVQNVVTGKLQVQRVQSQSGETGKIGKTPTQGEQNTTSTPRIGSKVVAELARFPACYDQLIPPNGVSQSAAIRPEGMQLPRCISKRENVTTLHEMERKLHEVGEERSCIDRLLPVESSAKVASVPTFLGDAASTKESSSLDARSAMDDPSKDQHQTWVISKPGEAGVDPACKQHNKSEAAPSQGNDRSGPGETVQKDDARPIALHGIQKSKGKAENAVSLKGMTPGFERTSTGSRCPLLAAELMTKHQNCVTCAFSIYVYVWRKTAKALHKYFKLMYGNGAGKLISKLTTDGMPKLQGDVQDAENFLSFCLDFRGWTTINGITAYIIGPLPVRPAAAQADERAAWDARVAEGLRYLCSAIISPDLKANVASNSIRATDGIANGPTGYEFLKSAVLQGSAEAPAIQQVLEGLRYQIDGSIVNFQSRFTKFVNAIHPRPAENVLCQKYIFAITADTSAVFEAEITTTIATDDQSDFNRFAGKLTKLISQKGTRMTAQNPTPVGQSAQVQANSSAVSDHDLLLQLQKQVQDLENELKSRRGTQSQNDNYSGKSKCDYTFPNGDICGGNHPRKNCWYEDPTRCRNPDIRRSVERKVQEKSTCPKGAQEQDDEKDDSDGEKALQASHLEGEDFSFCIDIIEKSAHPLVEYKNGATTPEEGRTGQNDYHNTSVKMIGGAGSFIIDTGVSNHIVYDQRCILHPEKHIPVDIVLKTATGSTKATSKGPASFIIQNEKGESFTLTRDVIFCPEFKVNLFSPQREFKDFGTRILFDDVCQLKFSESTIVPFLNENQLFKLPYAYPSKSSGVPKYSSNYLQPQDPKTGLHASWEHLIAPAVYHTLWEQLLLNQDKHNRDF